MARIVFLCSVQSRVINKFIPARLDLISTKEINIVKFSHLGFYKIKDIPEELLERREKRCGRHGRHGEHGEHGRKSTIDILWLNGFFLLLILCHLLYFLYLFMRICPLNAIAKRINSSPFTGV